MKALIIDDAITVRMMTKAILEELGFNEIYFSENGLEAINKLKKLEFFDLILVDWNMPLMNGFEFLKAVREEALYNPIKIIMMTTENGMDKIIDAIDAGVNEYMIKPFNKEILSDKLTIVNNKVNL